MDDKEKVQMYKSEGLHYCNQLLNEVQNTQDEIDSFFGGELGRAYFIATDKLLTKIKKVRTKLRNI